MIAELTIRTKNKEFEKKNEGAAKAWLNGGQPRQPATGESWLFVGQWQLMPQQQCPSWPPYYLASYVHEQKAHGLQWVWSIGLAMIGNKIMLLWCSCTMQNELKQHLPVFHQFQQIVYAYELFRCLDVEI